MSNRKLMSQAGGAIHQSPVNTKIGLKMKIPTMTAEYMEAMQVLNEKTMNEACAILLDDQNDNVDKLLDMYQKCQQAYQVVQKHQPANNTSNGGTPSGLPGAPNLSIPTSSRGGPPSTSAGPRPKLKKMGSLTGMMPPGSASNTKVGNVPLRRTMVAGVGAGKAASMSSLKSSNSSGSLKSSSSSGSLSNTTSRHDRTSGSNSSSTEDVILPPASKKSRTSQTSSPSNTPSERVMAPPQSALNFLAKLNKDKQQQQQKLQASESASTASSPSKSRNTTTSPPPPEPKSPPLRKNPPRGFMHRRSSS